MSLPPDSVFWIRSILFAAMIASMASYLIVNWRMGEEESGR